MAAMIEGISTFLGDYKFIGRLGRGRVGVVERAADESCVCDGREKKEVAIKVYASDAEHAFNREKDFLTILKGHPNVVSLLASHNCSTKAIVMPFYGERDLFWTVIEDGPLKSSKAKSVARDVLRALQHIHGLDIVHCDVSPKNVMVMESGQGVLVDFDQARWCSDTVQNATENLTPGFTAPEVILGQSCSSKSDVFSAGCVLHFMLLQAHPFTGGSPHPNAVLHRTVSCKVSSDLRSSNISSECKSLILSLVARDPHRRLSTGCALQQTWLAEGCNRAFLSSVNRKHADNPTGAGNAPRASLPRPSQKPLMSRAVSWAKMSMASPERTFLAGFGRLRSKFRREERFTSVFGNTDVAPFADSHA